MDLQEAIDKYRYRTVINKVTGASFEIRQVFERDRPAGNEVWVFMAGPGVDHPLQDIAEASVEDLEKNWQIVPAAATAPPIKYSTYWSGLQETERINHGNKKRPQSRSLK